ncbi:type IV pilus biogenesis protein PilM [Alkalibacterium olivapovliticus]|uniref:Type IV pilus assembly protein PilM n=1 Tax=Alkalibacterium olivapovliticus TaxID=99907 RepID=A0A2T0W9C9_9LACT|nr:pilus assembly protein PilM [Alkalibacterium olivapovliticus]PRY83236.1 type IV pilus assembly protein PilM [Alkalibacterium olivapovliticus]
MLFKSKPILLIQFLERSIRYIVMDASKKLIVEKDELVFDTAIIQEGKVTNVSLLQARLDSLIKEKKWKNAKVSIILPDDFVTIREEKIPVQLSYNEIKDYLHLHINQSIRLPFDDPRIDFEVISKDETTQTVFIAAYPGDQVRNYLSLLENVSLKPEVADISALCMYRVLSSQSKVTFSEDAHIMMLQWNPIDTSIMVFHKGIPQFNRHTRSTRLTDAWNLTKEGKWEWKIAESDLADFLEEQLNGLERFMEFYRYSVMDGEGSITNIVLSGYFPDLDRLKDLLNDRFSVTIHSLDLPAGLTQADAALYGLSLKENKKKATLFKQENKSDKVTKNFLKKESMRNETEDLSEGEVAND